MDELPTVIAIDANVLVCVCGIDGDRKEKIEHVFSELSKKKGKVLIPTPAIAEFLVKAEQAAIAVLDTLQKRSAVQIVSFDLAAAFENALMDAAALGRGDKRDGNEDAWQKIKIDRQIVAIAKVHGAKFILSDDGGVIACATRVGIRSSRIDDLPIPDHARQSKLPMNEPVQDAEELG